MFTHNVNRQEENEELHLFSFASICIVAPRGDYVI